MQGAAVGRLELQVEEAGYLMGIDHLVGLLGTQAQQAHKAEGPPTSSESQAVRTLGFVGHSGSATTTQLPLQCEMPTHG